MSLDTRRDTRTVEQFADAIQSFTRQERIWANALQIEWGNCKVYDNGCDNTGRVVNRATSDPDFKFVFDDCCELLVEIKTVPEHVTEFLTFKVTSLQGCLNQWLDTRMIVPRHEYYQSFRPTALSEMLQLPQQIYPKFSPNDLAVRIYRQDVSAMIQKKYVIQKSWSVSAKNYLGATHVRASQTQAETVHP